MSYDRRLRRGFHQLAGAAIMAFGIYEISTWIEGSSEFLCKEYKRGDLSQLERIEGVGMMTIEGAVSGLAAILLITLGYSGVKNVYYTLKKKEE